MYGLWRTGIIIREDLHVLLLIKPNGQGYYENTVDINTVLQGDHYHVVPMRTLRV